jgi:hypothetical protein
VTDLSVGLDASVTAGPIEGNALGALDATAARTSSQEPPRAAISWNSRSVENRCCMFECIAKLVEYIAVAMSSRVMVCPVVAASTGTVMSP